MPEQEIGEKFSKSVWHIQKMSQRNPRKSQGNPKMSQRNQKESQRNTNMWRSMPEQEIGAGKKSSSASNQRMCFKVSWIWHILNFDYSEFKYLRGKNFNFTLYCWLLEGWHDASWSPKLRVVCQHTITKGIAGQYASIICCWGEENFMVQLKYFQSSWWMWWRG